MAFRSRGRRRTFKRRGGFSRRGRSRGRRAGGRRSVRPMRIGYRF